MFAFLDDLNDPEELRALTAWKVHALTGGRNGTWSLSVTRNRRSTFSIDAAQRKIRDVKGYDEKGWRTAHAIKRPPRP